MQTEHGNQEDEDKDAFPLEKETSAGTAWSSPKRLAVAKYTKRDNSAQKKDPVAKELRFDRVTKKWNKNHTRPICGGYEEATKEEERQKPNTRDDETREGTKNQSR